MSNQSVKINHKENCKPAELIIKEIRRLLNNGDLKPGDRLPAERKLAEQFEVSRTHVREAIKKLEFYGVVKTLPQSGTIIAGMEISALDGLISDMLKLDNYDFFSLVEMRVILEREAARLCAMRRTEQDITELEQALAEYIEVMDDDKLSVEKDFIFHRKIASASKNMVLKSMLLIITPDILNIYNKQKVCDNVKSHTKEEHIELVKFIKNGDTEKAGELMEKHLQGVLDFARKEKVF